MSARRPLPGRPDTWNWWLRAVMEAFYAARDLWESARETFSKGYATEAREFDEQHPAPQLRHFLIDHSYRHLAAKGVAA